MAIIIVSAFKSAFKSAMKLMGITSRLTLDTSQVRKQVTIAATTHEQAAEMAAAKGLTIGVYTTLLIDQEYRKFINSKEAARPVAS